MTIQEELKTAADATRREVEAQVDTGAALEATRARAIGIRRRPDGRVLLTVAASVVLIAGLATFALLRDDDVVRTGPTATQPPTTVTTGPPTSSPSSTTIQAPVPTVAPTVAPTAATGDDLVTAPADLRIDFDGAADRRVGEVLDPSEVTPHVDSGCGYWPTEPGDVDQLHGLVEGAGTSSPRITDVRIDSSRYRTVSGVGVGTRLATLQRIYGDLVVDRADGWDSPTGGLLASYLDVAAIRSGDRAITFVLRDDVVSTVKVGAAEFWGDDEGCV